MTELLCCGHTGVINNDIQSRGKSLPNDKIVDRTKFKAFTDEKLNEI